MKFKKIPIFTLLFISNILSLQLISQQLYSGFNKNEFKELLLVSARTAQSEDYSKNLPPPTEFKKEYTSNVMWLDNLWELWMSNDDSVAVISIRGSTDQEVSWLVNFYATMTPAKGKLTLAKDEVFQYELAKNPLAAVHTGWLFSMAYLSKDILHKIDSVYNVGTKNFLLIGHSQGGAITYLLRTHLNNLQEQKKLPVDITFKTYCSASPKPGNLYFAYEYETITKNGWGFNVVNPADWVPESPISIQSLNDFNNTNVFKSAKGYIKKQKLPKKILFSFLYNKMDKPTKKARKKYVKTLGKRPSSRIMKSDVDFIPPIYYNSMHYVRTGNTIILSTDDKYFELFPDDNSNVFMHHSYYPYLYLLDKIEINDMN